MTLPSRMKDISKSIAVTTLKEDFFHHHPHQNGEIQSLRTAITKLKIV